MASDYTLGLRPGFKFDPPESELLQRYLRPKVLAAQPKPGSIILPEIDLYGNLPPWDLFDSSTSPIYHYQQHWFCFTQLKKKTLNSSNFDRTVGDYGSWFGSQKPHDVFLGKVLVGQRRVFNFVLGTKTKTTTKTQWLMHELTLPERHSSSLALCKVIKRIPRPKHLPKLPLRPPLPIDAPFPFALIPLPPSDQQCPPPMAPLLPDVASTSTSPPFTSTDPDLDLYPGVATTSTFSILSEDEDMEEQPNYEQVLVEEPDQDPGSSDDDEFANLLESTLTEDEDVEEQPDCE